MLFGKKYYFRIREYRKTEGLEDGRFGRREYKNTGIQDISSAFQNICLVSLSPRLLVFFHQAQVYRLVSLSSRLLVFFHLLL